MKLKIITLEILFILWTPIPREEQNSDLPDLSMKSNYGVITQNGRDLSINGHQYWQAYGQIREDGRVYLFWTTTEGTQKWHGVYQVKSCPRLGGIHLDGRYVPEENAEFDLFGNLIGNCSRDVVRRE